jgi:hypothetical protein
MKDSSSPKLWFSFLICCLLVAPSVSAQTAAAKKETVRQARQAYYNLRNEGLVEFQCSSWPNWEAMIADLRKTNPAAADEGLKTLNQIRFSVSLGPDGAVAVTHNDVPAGNDEMVKSLNQIYSGMEQTLTGFYQTASIFLLMPPFPEVDSEYQLEEQETQYRLLYKEGAADVVITMSKDLAITSLRIKTAEFDSTIETRFTKTAKGFLLARYVGDYQSKSSAESTHLNVRIDYLEASGLQLPQKVNLTGTYGGNPVAGEVSFSDYKVKKR